MAPTASLQRMSVPPVSDRTMYTSSGLRIEHKTQQIAGDERRANDAVNRVLQHRVGEPDGHFRLHSL